MSQLKEHIGEMKEKSCENDTDRVMLPGFWQIYQGSSRFLE
jgi:hypothetical protein